MSDIGAARAPGNSRSVVVSPCPSDEELDGFAEGRLSDPAIEAIGQHLEECGRCRFLLDRSTTTDPMAAALPRLTPPDPFASEPGLKIAEQVVGNLAPPSADDTAAPPPAARQWPAFAPPLPGTDAVGRLGPYAVLRELGAGAMGLVFEAEDRAGPTGRPEGDAAAPER